MTARLHLRLLVSGLILASCLIGTAAGTSLGIDWKQSPYLADNTFLGVSLNPDASTVFTGGNNLLVRGWDTDEHWGGQTGFIAAMSTDGKYIITGTGSLLTLYNVNGTQLWSYYMEGQIRAVAVSPGARLIVSADDLGNYNTWGPTGDFYGRNRTDVVKRLAIATAGDFVVATTQGGIRTFTASLEPVWKSDSKYGSLDDYIALSADGSTVITAGGPRVSSYTRKGTLTWKADVTDTVINDMACSEDCSLIVVASQDNTVQGIDRYGKTHWTYRASQWPVAVALSRNGAVVAAGINDGTLVILNHNGDLLTQRKFDSRIQPRTLAVSRDGTRIAAADRYYLYGLTLSGITSSDDSSDTVFIAAPLNPVTKTTVATTPVMTTLPEVTLPEEARLTVTTAPPVTKKSPVTVWMYAPAIAAILSLMRVRRR